MGATRNSLKPTTVNYKSATEHLIKTIGRYELTAQLDTQEEVRLPFAVSVLMVVSLSSQLTSKNGNTALRHLYWWQATTEPCISNHKKASQMGSCKPIQEHVQKFSKIFKDELKCLKNFVPVIIFEPLTKPVFCQPWPVPMASTEKLGRGYCYKKNDLADAYNCTRPVLSLALLQRIFRPHHYLLRVNLFFFLLLLLNW